MSTTKVVDCRDTDEIWVYLADRHRMDNKKNTITLNVSIGWKNDLDTAYVYDSDEENRMMQSLSQQSAQMNVMSPPHNEESAVIQRS